MSQMDGHKKEIDGVIYTVYMLPPKTAMDMLVDIGKVVGPSLGTIMDAASRNGGVSELLGMSVTSEFFSKAAGELFQRMDKAVLRSVIGQLAQVSMADGVKLEDTFDIHFRGKLGSMVKWLAFALKVQFGNFFSALGDATAQGARKMKAASQSPITSTG